VRGYSRAGGQAGLQAGGRSGIAEHWFCDQQQDHFDADNKVRWCQRYFVNRTHWDGHGRRGPVFLCVGGEGPPLEADVVSQSVHCNDMVELAERLGAMMFAVEHRYYGRSIPAVPDFSTRSLRFLSSRQALADLARFHAFATEAFALQGAKWVTFGGSYPGMLAGFARLKYPGAFHAAVSSSAPVRAQVDFRGYLDVVAASLAQPSVGGSTACAAAVQEGHAEIGRRLETEGGRRELERLFRLCGERPLDSADSRALWAGSGVVPVDAQEDAPGCEGPLCNIRRLCAAVGESAEADSVAMLASLSASVSGGECVDVAYDGYVRQLTNTTLEGGAGRIWFYQTCNEFAFYQTCEVGSNCPFTRGLNTLGFNLQQCAAAFNISADTVRANVEESNRYYGADRPRGTRVLYPNGQIDPWSYLSVLVTPGPGLPTLWVPGASHHYWTRPSQPSDAVEDTRAKRAIWEQVTQWLREDDDASATLVI